MRKVSVFVITCLVLVAVAASDLNACGDKMLLLGRAVQFSRVQTQKNPLSIILYKHTGLAKESGMNDFEIVMKRIGHKVRIAKDLMQLNEALSSGPVNYVAADPTDVPTVQRTAGAAPSKPRVISMDVPAKAKTDQYVALLPETITNK